MESTARLVGSEVAAILSESAIDQLFLRSDWEAGQRLEQMVADLAAHSEVVASISVVDVDGLVVVSKDIPVGQQLALPAVIFHSDRRPQFVSTEAGRDGGVYHLFVPLIRDDAILGYLRVSIGNQRIEQLYRRAQHQLATLVAAGLAFIAVVGFLVELQVARTANKLTMALESAIRGETSEPAKNDEFAKALNTAHRAGKELSAARAQTADAQGRFSELMRVIDVGILLIGPVGEIDFANEQARRLCGCPNAGELEERWGSLSEYFNTVPFDSASTGGSLDVEVPTSGRSNRIRLEYYPRYQHGGWLILVRSRDMLDALENELRLAIQMRGFAQFYVAFVHDLKAPLNAMVLNIELLKQSLNAPAGGDETELKARQLRYAQVLVQEVMRLDRSLGTVLTHASSPKEMEQQFDLRELIDELGTLLTPLARKQRIELTMPASEQPLPITGHRDRLKQALLNIAINGLESMSHGGALTITTTRRDGVASIALQDSGPGIPPDLLNEIYNMHFTTKDGGTGVGLYVARSVIQAHGGRIRVDSTADHGTCFHVDLPCLT